MKASRAAALAIDEDLVLPQVRELRVRQRPKGSQRGAGLAQPGVPMLPIAGVQGLNTILNSKLN